MATRSSQPGGCCKPWAEVPAAQRNEWPWQVLHEYGHSRVPFTPATLAVAARVDPSRARELIAEGVALKWIWPADPEVSWYGRLTKKR